MQANPAHQAVHQEGCPGHVAGVFQQADEEEEQADLREENHHRPDTGDSASGDQVVEIARGHARADPLGQGIDSRLDAVHRVLRQPEDGLEHQRHHRDKNEGSPNAVGHHAVDPVGEQFVRGRGLAGDVLLDGEEPGVAGFDGGAAPVHAGCFETSSSR